MREEIDQRNFVLATLPPSQGQIQAALVVAGFLLVAFVVTVPFVNTPLPRVDAVIPIIAAASHSRWRSTLPTLKPRQSDEEG